jgi:hypothetical protein
MVKENISEILKEINQVRQKVNVQEKENQVQRADVDKIKSQYSRKLNIRIAGLVEKKYKHCVEYEANMIQTKLNLDIVAEDINVARRLPPTRGKFKPQLFYPL